MSSGSTNGKRRGIGVGIDVSSSGGLALIVDDEERAHGGFMTLEHTRESVERLLARIVEAEQELGGDCDVTINLEATGVHHVPFVEALSKFHRVNVWQPRQVRETSKKNIRKQKTDRRDARILSTIHWDKTKKPPSTNYDDQERLNMREVVRLKFKYEDLRAAALRRLRRTIFAAFPLLASKIGDVNRPAVRALLRECRTPQDIIGLGADKINALFSGHRRGQRSSLDGRRLVELAERSLVCQSLEHGASLAVRMLLETVEHYDGQIAVLNRELLTHWERNKQRLVVATFPYVTPLRAAMLDAEFGGLARFASGDAAVSFAGLENHVHSSGKKHINGPMTKAGSPTLRRILWGILSGPNARIPRLTEYMARMINEGSHRSEAIHGASKKLIRLFHALDKNQTPFRASAWGTPTSSSSSSFE
jgi:transposase